jgi:hypothetical protein
MKKFPVGLIVGRRFGNAPNVQAVFSSSIVGFCKTLRKNSFGVNPDQEQKSNL